MKTFRVDIKAEIEWRDEYQGFLITWKGNNGKFEYQYLFEDKLTEEIYKFHEKQAKLAFERRAVIESIS